jgi:hypothetical protein
LWKCHSFPNIPIYHKSEKIKDSAGKKQEEICSSYHKYSYKEDCEEGIVELQAKLISSLDELTKEAILEKEIISLKIQLE